MNTSCMARLAMAAMFGALQAASAAETVMVDFAHVKGRVEVTGIFADPPPAGERRCWRELEKLDAARTGGVFIACEDALFCPHLRICPVPVKRLSKQFLYKTKKLKHLNHRHRSTKPKQVQDFHPEQTIRKKK